ncbi:MAG: tRNA pseudouridine(38-40) synthase TruA [Clostridia bacterium]|nr:tRNA pseudouridine(38-40) synthase TruA [Clostridia bacterium]
MRKFLVEIQYNGKSYSGFQNVSNGVTVESKLLGAIEKVFEQKTKMVGCSRTDAGVSAESYFFDFAVDTKLPVGRVPFKLNRYLPKDIQAIGVREVELGFNARHNAISKTYEYSFYLSEHLLPLINSKSYRLTPSIDINAMQMACDLIIGKHNFIAFKTPDKNDLSTVRTVFSAKIISEEKRLTFRICGDGFLYNMVRILAGTLVQIGEGKMSLNELELLLSGNKLRGDNPALTLPPNALLLKSVQYKQ